VLEAGDGQASMAAVRHRMRHPARDEAAGTAAGRSMVVMRHRMHAVPEIAEPQAGRKESRTWRRWLSTFVSSTAIDCQVPSARRPPMTGMLTDGGASSGSK
jgi:hypothetical protein